MLIRKIPLLTLSASVFILSACASMQQQNVDSGSGTTDLQKQIDILQEENSQLKKLGELNKENIELKQQKKNTVKEYSSTASKSSTNTVEKNSEMDINAKRQQLKVLSDDYSKAEAGLVNFQGDTRQQLLDNLKITKNRLSQWEKYVQIFEERKLTNAETNASNSLLTELAQFIVERAKLTRSSISQGLDANYSEYKNMLESFNLHFDKLLDYAKEYDKATELKMLEILRTQAFYISIFDDLTTKASTRSLTDIESTQINVTMKEISETIKKFADVQSSGYIPTTTAPSYVPAKTTYKYPPHSTPVPQDPSHFVCNSGYLLSVDSLSCVPSPSQATQSHQEVCNQLTIQQSLSGGFGSIDSMIESYNAGCSTIEQYCNGLAIARIGLPAECR